VTSQGGFAHHLETGQKSPNAGGIKHEGMVLIDIVLRGIFGVGQPECCWAVTHMTTSPWRNPTDNEYNLPDKGPFPGDEAIVRQVVSWSMHAAKNRLRATPSVATMAGHEDTARLKVNRWWAA